jgi:hypothetical protein
MPHSHFHHEFHHFLKHIIMYINCLVYAFVCQGPETQISNWVSRSWNPDPVCPSVEVLKPRSQIETPNRIQKRQGLKKCPPELEGPKTIQDLNHTLLFLYLLSPESWVSTNPSPKSQCPGFKLLIGVPTVKEPNGKNKPSVGVFGGCRRHWPEYPNSVVSLLSLCSSRREGARHGLSTGELGTGGLCPNITGTTNLSNLTKILSVSFVYCPKSLNDFSLLCPQFLPLCKPFDIYGGFELKAPQLLQFIIDIFKDLTFFLDFQEGGRLVWPLLKTI